MLSCHDVQITYKRRQRPYCVMARTARKDACYRGVKASYKKFPSARASQAIAKCRKANHIVHKGDAGKDLRRWQKEKWVDKATGKPCGHPGKESEYCRPTKKVNSKTPVMPRGKMLRKNISRKRNGKNVVRLKR